MSSRNPDYQFVSTDTEQLEAKLISAYEKITGVSVHPGSPERLFIAWVAYTILLERIDNNYTGNQNIPSRAEGANLDALGELFYVMERPTATSAACTVRFVISEAQESAILVPAGTRVTDASRALVWETREDAYIPAGMTYIDLTVYCQTPGLAGNGYTAGQINTIVDVFDYYLSCENITESDGGSDAATDEEFYELMRASMDAHSTAGAVGSYIYWAKRVSTEILDVVPNSPIPGEVYIYVLTKDGTIAGEELKKAVFAACNGDEVRPFTDHVQMADPGVVTYDIDFTYYVPNNTTISSTAIHEAVEDAVNGYIAWQSGRLGRDINPSELYGRIMKTGVKRIELRKPIFMALQDGKLDPEKVYEISQTIPQVAKLGTKTIIVGGYEDE